MRAGAAAPAATSTALLTHSIHGPRGLLLPEAPSVPLPINPGGDSPRGRRSAASPPRASCGTRGRPVRGHHWPADPKPLAPLLPKAACPALPPHRSATRPRPHPSVIWAVRGNTERTWTGAKARTAATVCERVCVWEGAGAGMGWDGAKVRMGRARGGRQLSRPERRACQPPSKPPRLQHVTQVPALTQLARTGHQPL